ncbi:MAG: Sec-independent protein translocase subunit TatA/TatB [Pseudobdellovibrionaceae bacterium]
MSEIIFLAILALIVIGPKELPELARTLGRFLNELKRSTNVLGEELKNHTRIDRINLNEPIAKPTSHNENSNESQQLELAQQANLEIKPEDQKEEQNVHEKRRP